MSAIDTSTPPPSPRPRLSPERAALYWIGGLFLGLIVAIVVILSVFDWNMLRGPIARFASNATHRNVRIDGDLKVHLLTFTPRVSVSGLKVGQPAWNGTGDMAVIDKVVVEAKLIPLLTGKIVMPLFEVDHPILDLKRDATGRANWDIGDKKAPSKPFKLPPIQRFIINQGHLNYVDLGKKLNLSGVIDSNENAGGASAHAFSLTGKGSLNNNPFGLNITGGALLNVNANAPYPFSGDVRAGDTRIQASGTIAKAFDLSSYTTSLHVSGSDLAKLYDLTGLALPNTPRYNLHARLSHSAKHYQFDNLGGVVGSSDLHGTFSVDTKSGRPFLDATLRSRSLDFNDLATLLGAAPAGKAAVNATADQKAVNAHLAATQRILPDSTLQVDRLRKMDARLDFHAESIKDTVLPITEAYLKLSLDQGLLTLDPLQFNFPQGRLVSSISLNGRGAVPVTTVDARLSNVQLKNFVPGPKGEDVPIEGDLLARVKLVGRGDSVHKAAAASNGAVTVVIPHGHIRSAFAELLGVNVGKGLSLLLSQNKGASDIRCGIASFDVKDGVLHADQVVFDTDVVKVSGTGQVNLGDESLDLTLKGDTKKFRITHVFLPITIGGHLRAPTIGVQPGPAIAQGGVAVALGAVFSPLAAILPFVDPGLAKNADCSALMADAKQTAAPVKGTLTTTPAVTKH